MPRKLILVFDSMERGSYNTPHLWGTVMCFGGFTLVAEQEFCRLAALIDNYIFQEGIRGQRIMSDMSFFV